MTQRFVEAVKSFAARSGIEIVSFRCGERKDDRTLQYRRHWAGGEGVLYIGKAQEKAKVVHTESRQATITSGLTTEHTIGGLTNGTEYTVRIISTRYPIADGPPSETATGTPRAGAGGGSRGGGGTPTPTPEPQTQQSQTPLTASFVSVPATHDGETPFWLELSFDAPIVQGSKPQLRELLDVTGGSETRFRRKDGQLDRWQIRIDPSSPNAVTVTLAPSPPCGQTGAVCTEDGRTFTTGLATQIHGPASGNNNWSDDSAGTAVTPVPAVPLAGVGIRGLLLALLGSRAARPGCRRTLSGR